MDMELWFAFMVACWLIALSPGSGAILAISHGSVYGVRRTSATIAGLQTGLLVILLVAGLGVGSVLIASATAFTVLKVLGALYLMYLGIKQWRNTHGMLEGDVVQQAVAEGQGDWKKRFMTGMLTNVTNPKGIVFMVAVLPQFINASRPIALQLAIIYVPWLHPIFKTTPLGLGDLAVCLGAALVVYVVVELEKAWRRQRRRPPAPTTA